MITINNITILIICITILGVLSLFQGMENVLTTIVGGLIGFLAKDRVITSETVDDYKEQIIYEVVFEYYEFFEGFVLYEV